MNNDFVAIAVLGKPRGNRGEVTAIPLTSKPERFADLRQVYLSGEASPFDIERTWKHNGTLIFKLAGVDSISGAEALRGKDVLIPEAERVQPDTGEFFHSDLIGCELRDRVSGRVYGKITSVEEYGGPALLEIDSGKMLVPFVAAICVDICPKGGYVAVDLPVGLEDLA